MPFLPLLLAALLAAPIAPAAVDDNAGPRAAAQAFEAAERQGDRAALERLLAPDFLFVRGSGRIGDRADFLNGFAGPGARVSALDISDPLFLRVAPDTAVVGGEGRISGTEDGRPFRNRFRFSDLLVRRDGRWLVAYEQVTGLSE